MTDIRRTDAMQLATTVLEVATKGAGFTDITAQVKRFAEHAGIAEGMIFLFMRHTSASLTIQENADPTVLMDLTTALETLAPQGRHWRHDTEGPDDMPAHVKTMLTSVNLHVPVSGGRLALGTWQAIYVIEHRAHPHRREIVLQALGSKA